jgi:hypothetical protein
MGTTMPHGDKRAFWITEQELAQRFCIGTFGLFQIRASVGEQRTHERFAATSLWLE